MQLKMICAITPMAWLSQLAAVAFPGSLGSPELEAMPYLERTCLRRGNGVRWVFV